MNPHVKSVQPLDDYELEVSFENGESRRFDVKPYLGRGIFVRLRELTLFRPVRVIAGSIEWPGGLDLSYDTFCGMAGAAAGARFDAPVQVSAGVRGPRLVC